MKVLVAFSAVIALAVAAPGFLHAPLAYTANVAYTAPLAYAAPVVPVEVSSQYHAQDSLGQYNYGYADALSSKTEIKSIDGVTRGAYSYVDGEGKVQNVHYTADAVNGFQVSASNLPVAPKALDVEKVEEPKPVEDTPEVAEAKAAHLAAVKEAEERNAAAEVEVVAPVAAPVAVSYAAPVAHYAYSAPAVTAYTAPVVSAYAHHPYAYSYGYQPHQYSHFGYRTSSVAPAYDYHAYAPIHV